MVEETPRFSADLIWLCFVNYVKTYEETSDLSRAKDAVQSSMQKKIPNQPRKTAK